MSQIDEALEALLAELESRARSPRAQDAIDRILAGPRRETSATSLRDHEAVRRFRQELSDGLIKVDTANQLLRLIRVVLAAVLAA